MGYVLLTFVLCVVTILGLYWALIVQPESRQARAVTDRLGRLDRPVAPTGATSVTAPDVRVTSVPLLDRLMAQHAGFTRAIEQLLLEAGSSLSVGALVALSAAAGLVGGIIGLAALRSASAAALFAAMGAVAPLLFIQRRRRKRLQTFEEQFPEAIDLVARALRAGHAFTTGLSIAAEEMPAPVGAEFKRVYDQQSFGMSMPEALRAMAHRVPVLDARFFVTAVLTQRESGGNLAEVLDNLSSVMRDRFKVKRQIRVVSAHGRISGWVLSLVPPALAVFLYTVQPEFMGILVEDPIGVRLVMVAVVLQLLGTYVISRLVRIEY
jgi:tight adherence protein B